MKSFNEIVELLKREEVFRELVPELTNFAKIMLTLPASTCSLLLKSIATLNDNFVCRTFVRKDTFYLAQLYPDMLVIHCLIRMFLPSVYFPISQLINKFNLTAMVFLKKVNLQIQSS